MALYIDPPRWPAHGTVFSHLVSDRSYEELHDAAAAVRLSKHAFDLDHYDVPKEWYDAAVAAGARPVSGAALVRVLRASGLRVPARERPEKALPALRRRWDSDELGPVELREDLLQRWSEPHRHYHTPVHLLECLTAVDELAIRETGTRPESEVLLALWFHDAVYEGAPGEDEERSAALAQAALGGDLGDEVARLVLLTRDHVVAPGDTGGALVVDADLAILAAERERYRRYVGQVRHEYSHVPQGQWVAGRSEVLRSFLDRRRLFRTGWAHDAWTGVATRNLTSEIGYWEGQGVSKCENRGDSPAQ